MINDPSTYLVSPFHEAYLELFQNAVSGFTGAAYKQQGGFDKWLVPMVTLRRPAGSNSRCLLSLGKSLMDSIHMPGSRWGGLPLINKETVGLLSAGTFRNHHPLRAQ